MLPSAGVTCSTMSSSVSRGGDLREAAPAGLDVVPARFARPLFERVKDVDRFGEFRNIEDAMLALFVHSDFIDTSANPAHALAAFGDLAALHEEKLVSALMTRAR